ncbi:MAG: hypothetical protein ABIN97_10055 [Ginsengibacter sp.]
MISFITYTNANEQIEIIADKQGIEDLIFYLEGIKKDKDHMHLVIDNELNNYPISNERKEQVVLIKHVRLQYADSLEWENSN